MAMQVWVPTFPLCASKFPVTAKVDKIIKKESNTTHLILILCRTFMLSSFLRVWPLNLLKIIKILKVQVSQKKKDEILICPPRQKDYKNHKKLFLKNQKEKIHKVNIFV
jgi:hypothetical protein